MRPSKQVALDQPHPLSNRAPGPYLLKKSATYWLTLTWNN
jgi:hypothetical protein